MPEGAAEDSIDVPAALTGGERMSGTAPPRTELIHHSGAGVFALRRDEDDARWKMIFECSGDGRGDGPLPGSTGQLYDLSRDLAETTNLWHRQSDVVHALSARLEARRCFSKRRLVDPSL
ncbi:MAG: hypothetical protein OXH96_12380 [Spirochaetaceae bacterium]|nr:hypothetical protein [Spirochaetaceae bacterium]